MDKTKKKRMIIAIVLSSILLVSIVITTLLIVTRKKYDIYSTSAILYNNHEEMKIVTFDSGYTMVNDSNPTYYSNGTTFVKNGDGKIGVYSFNEGELIIPTIHSNAAGINNIPLKTIALTKDNYTGDLMKETGEYLFKSGNSTTGAIKFYNDEGDILRVTEIDQTTNKTYSHIMQRKMGVEKTRKGNIKVSTRNKFDQVKIEINDINYLSTIERFGESYEMWQITDINNNDYINLYNVNDGKRELVQTLNNANGNDSIIGSIEGLTPFILSNGKVSYLNPQEKNDAGINGSVFSQFDKITIYNDDLEEEKTVTLKNAENMVTSFILGNYLYAQYLTPATEEDYDFAVPEEYGLTSYFRLETYRLNFKNGKYKKVKFKYLIEEVNASFNDSVATLKVKEIDSKELSDKTITLLINDNLDKKEIDFEINEIRQINKKRFLIESTDGLYIVDRDYDIVSKLGNFDDYFTTEESVILKKDGKSYVSTLDGLIVKQYKDSEIINIHHDTYYMIKTTTKKNELSFTEYYLERLGFRNSTPIHSIEEHSTSYAFNNNNYVAYDNSVLEDGVSIITRVKTNGSRFDYEFYNYEGDLLLTIPNFTIDNRILIHHGYSDDEGHVLYISTATGGVGYTLYVDR